MLKKKKESLETHTEVVLEEMRVWNLLYDNRGGVKWVECRWSKISYELIWLELGDWYIGIYNIILFLYIFGIFQFKWNIFFWVLIFFSLSFSLIYFGKLFLSNYVIYINVMSLLSFKKKISSHTPLGITNFFSVSINLFSFFKAFHV